jgi:hypothetical protein
MDGCNELLRLLQLELQFWNISTKGFWNLLRAYDEKVHQTLQQQFPSLRGNSN